MAAGGGRDGELSGSVHLYVQVVREDKPLYEKDLLQLGVEFFPRAIFCLYFLCGKGFFFIVFAYLTAFRGGGHYFL